MASSGYTALTFTAGEVPTTAQWNLLWSNDASFNTGNGFNDGIIITRHLAAGVAFAPAALNPYKFSVYRNAAWSAPAATFSVIQMDTKDYDTGTNVDIVTNPGRFTAAIAGFYHFNVSVGYNITAIGNGFTPALYKNGTEARRGMQVFQTVAGGTLAGIVSADVKLLAGDYVEPFMFNGGTQVVAAGVTGSPYTYFQGQLISAL